MNVDRRLSQDNEPLTRGDFKILMAEHEGNEARMKQEMLDRFMGAFPGGDPVPHCNYHQAKINAAQAEQRFWEMAQGKVVEKGLEGLFGALKVVVLLALTGLAFKLGLPIPFLGGKP